MSNRNSGASGYVVALSDLRKVMGDENMERVIAATDDGDVEEITDLVNSLLPAEFPPVESVFILAPEDESDDLEQDVWYACWDDSDLYVKVSTPELLMLNAKGVSPQFRQWVVWG